VPFYLKPGFQQLHEDDRRRAALKIQGMYRTRAGRMAAKRLRDEAHGIEEVRTRARARP
jgi:hypothetical protein